MSASFAPAVPSLDFDPDDVFVSVGSSLKLWDWRFSKTIASVDGLHGSSFVSACCRVTDRFVATGCEGASADDVKIKIWDVLSLSDPSARPLWTSGGHSGRVNSLVFAPSMSMLFSCSDDHTVRCWRLPFVGDELNISAIPAGTVAVRGSSPILCLCALDNDCIAFGDADNVTTGWDSAKQSVCWIRRPSVQAGRVNDVCFEPFRRVLYSVGDDRNMICVVPLDDDDTNGFSFLDNPVEPARCCVLGNKGNPSMVIGRADGAAVGFDTRSILDDEGSCRVFMHRAVGHTRVSALCPLRCDRFAASDADGALIVGKPVFGVKDSLPIFRSQDAEGQVCDLAYLGDPDGGSSVSSGRTPAETESGDSSPKTSRMKRSKAESGEVESTSGLMLSVGVYPDLQVRQLPSMRVSTAWKTSGSHNFEVFPLDDLLFAVTNYGAPYNVELFRYHPEFPIPTMKRVRCLTGHTESVVRVCDYDSPLFLTCSFDSTIRLWSSESERCMAIFSAAGNDDQAGESKSKSPEFSSVACVPCLPSRLIVGGAWRLQEGEANTPLLHVFDSATGKLITNRKDWKVLNRSHPMEGNVRDLRVDDYGLLSVGEDGILRVWDLRVTHMECVNRVDIGTGLTVMRLLPERREAVVMDEDGHIHLVDTRRFSKICSFLVHKGARGNALGLSRVEETDCFISASYFGLSVASWRIDGKIFHVEKTDNENCEVCHISSAREASGPVIDEQLSRRDVTLAFLHDVMAGARWATRITFRRSASVDAPTAILFAVQ